MKGWRGWNSTLKAFRELERRTPLAPINRKRRKREWARAYGSEARVAAVKKLPCVACGRSPCDNAHTEGGGMGRKAHWSTIVPLCRPCHNSLHALGSVELFDAKRGTDLRASARDLAETLKP